jgi:hypothetical protein
MTAPTVFAIHHHNAQVRGIQARGLSAPDEAAYKAARREGLEVRQLGLQRLQEARMVQLAALLVSNLRLVGHDQGRSWPQSSRVVTEDLTLTNATRKLDVYDAGGGAVNLAWAEFPSVIPDSYNVYADGALKQNVVGFLATVTGLIGWIPHTFYVAAVKAGVEIDAISPITITLAPAAQL